MKRLGILVIGTICILVLVGYLNKGNKEGKMIETAAQEEQEINDFESKQNLTKTFESSLKNELEVNLEELYILNNEVKIYLNYPELTEEEAQTVSVDILEYLQERITKFDVEIKIKSEKQNDYGQSEEYYPFTLKVKNDTLNKFNFENFNKNNLLNTADYYAYYE